MIENKKTLKLKIYSRPKIIVVECNRKTLMFQFW